jgi:hypothetical protein
VNNGVIDLKLKSLSIAAILIMSAHFANARDFDLAGMKLGATGEQIVEKLQSYKEGTSWDFNQWELPEGSKWIANGRAIYTDMTNPDDIEHERYAFAFTGIGSGNKLFAISREMHFRPSQRPNYKATIEAALQKFGKPSISEVRETNARLAWKFTDIKGDAVPLESELGCTTATGFPISLDEEVLEVEKVCGLYIQMSIEGDETGLADKMIIDMFNYLDATKDAQADNAKARELINNAKAKNESEAAPVPQL